MCVVVVWLGVVCCGLFSLCCLNVFVGLGVGCVLVCDVVCCCVSFVD